MTRDELRAYLGFMSLEDIVGYIKIRAFPGPFNGLRPHDQSALWDRKEVDAALDAARDARPRPIDRTVWIQRRATGDEFTGGNQPKGSLEETPAMTPEQLREARKLLGWSQVRVAMFSDVPRNVIETFETQGRVPRPPSPTPRIDRLSAIRLTLETAGVEFIEGDVPGVKLRRSASTS